MNASRLVLAAFLLEALTVSARAAEDSSATGYGGAGNVLNPDGQTIDRDRDPDGLSVIVENSRTPSGLLYPPAFKTPELTQSQSNPDWWSTGWVEAGGMGTFGSDRKSAALNEYGDWKSSPVASNLGFLAENQKTALYIQASAENLGRTDQYYQVTIGRYGVFDFTTFFDSVPHLYSTTAKSIWTGVGTDTLTLSGGLTPAASTAAQVTAVATAAGTTDIQITREKAGMSFTYTPDRDLEFFARLSDEWRDGTQPTSATFGYPFQDGATQLIEPIHYQTVDLSGGVRFKRDDIQANLTYTGSYFMNRDLGMTWQNPGLAQNFTPNAFVPTLGQLSLPPNNDMNTIKGDVAWVISPQLRFAGNLSYSLLRQDDTLLPPTADSGTINIANPINLSQWNTTAALSEPRANAAIDVFNAFAQFHDTISPSVSVTAEMRDHDEKNLTNYLAYNPTTGQYGYIAIDGGLAPFDPSLSGVYVPGTPGSLVQIRNMPFANNNLQFTVSGAWRVYSHWKLDLSYAHNNIQHSVRELPDADDNIARLQLGTAGYSWGSVRLSYEFARRLGSDYDFNPYTPYYTASLPGYIPATANGDPAFALSDLRKFDVANRTEHVVRDQTNFILSDTTDLQLTGQVKVDDYDAAYGLQSTTDATGNVALNYQPASKMTLTGYFNFQYQNRGIANINASGTGVSGAAGGPDYPLSNAWTETAGSDNFTLGLSARRSWGDVSLITDYTFTRAYTALTYTYASTGAFYGLLTPAQAGNAFPDITFESHALQTSLRWQSTPKLSYRLTYRLATQNINDFHYTGLTPGVIGNNYYLGVVPENFAAQSIGLFVQYVF